MYSVPLRRALVTGTDLPYPGRRRRGRSAEGRRGRRRSGGEPPRAQDDHLELDRLGRLCHPRADQDRRRRRRAKLQVRLRRDRRLDQPVDGADRRRPPRRHGGRHRDAGRPDHQLVRPRALADRTGRPWLRRRDIETLVGTAFREKVRFIGAGTIGVAAIWTLLRIIGPDHHAASRRRIAASRARKAGGAGQPAADRARHSDRHRRRRRSCCSMVPIGLLLSAFAQQRADRRRARPRRSSSASSTSSSPASIIAAITGYMAGLIGASNSPVSGVGILSVLGISLILAALFAAGRP